MAPTHHALHITTETIARTSIFNLPFGVQVICTRAGGWEVWHSERPPEAPTLIAAEYPAAYPVSGLRLDVAGHVIVDSLTPRGRRRQRAAMTTGLYFNPRRSAWPRWISKT